MAQRSKIDLITMTISIVSLVASIAALIVSYISFHFQYTRVEEESSVLITKLHWEYDVPFIDRITGEDSIDAVEAEISFSNTGNVPLFVTDIILEHLGFAEVKRSGDTFRDPGRIVVLPLGGAIAPWTYLREPNGIVEAKPFPLLPGQSLSRVVGFNIQGIRRKALDASLEQFQSDEERAELDLYMRFESADHTGVAVLDTAKAGSITYSLPTGRIIQLGTNRSVVSIGGP